VERPVIQGVTFDLWSTLILDRPDLMERRKELRVRRMWELLTRAGWEVKMEALARGYDRSGEQLVQVQAQERDMDTREQLQVLLSHALGQGDPFPGEELSAQLEEAYVQPVVEVPPLLVSSAVWVLDELRREGLKLGLISNTGRTPGWMSRRLLAQYGLDAYFDTLTFSNELGFTKPHSAIFLSALEKLNLEPQAVVHIGDDPRTDIKGAKGVGMRAVLLNPPGQAGAGDEADSCIADLRELPPLVRSWRRVAPPPT